MSSEHCNIDVICDVFKSTKGGLKLFIDGYAYNKNKSKDDTFYWFCDSRYSTEYPCKATVITVINGKGQHVLDKKTNRHNHKAEPLKKKIAEFKDKVKKIACVADDSKLHDILQTARNSVGGLPENVPSTTALRQMIYRHKCKSAPHVDEPMDTLFELIDSETQINGVNFVLKDHVYDGNERLVIMSTYHLMFLLGNANYWILDSIEITSQAIFKYLHTLHGNIVNDKQITFPLLFCMSTQKSQLFFDKMFNIIMEYSSENKLRLCPQICIVDFDADVILSLHTLYQGIQLHGCNFHLRHRLFRKLQSLNFEKKLATDINFNLEMKCLLALSHLNSEDIPRYFKKLQENLQDADSTQMAKWFAAEYIFGGDAISNFPPQLWSHKPHINIPSCQDCAEAWHHQIKMFINKQHPGFYRLTKKLIKETLHQMHEIEKIMMEPPPSPPQKRPRRRKKRAPGLSSRIDSILDKKNDMSELDVLKSIAKLLRL